MVKSILIIDDEVLQAENLAKAIRKEKSRINCFFESEENSILETIENKYFDIAIVDLRMDNFSIDGFSIIDKIITVNPFAKIIIVSAFTNEYIDSINKILITGKIIAICEKKEFTAFLNEILFYISKYEEDIDENSSETSKALLNFYITVKNEQDTYQKGILFEHFITLLFSNMGFLNIRKRVIDLSRNEVDLIIRNDIKDPFFSKFNPYFLVECKNKPDENVGKNDFIQFNSKIEKTNGLVNLGFLITSGYIAKTTYTEAFGNSKDPFKVIFLSNPEIEKLINSNNPLHVLKLIIDDQVKGKNK